MSEETQKKLDFLEAASLPNLEAGVELTEGIKIEDFGQYRRMLIRDFNAGSNSPRTLYGSLQRGLDNVVSFLLVNEFQQKLNDCQSGNQVQKVSTEIANKKEWVSEEGLVILLKKGEPEIKWLYRKI